MDVRQSLVKKAYSYACAYCAKAERSPKQVQEKINRYGLTEEEQDQVIHDLMQEKYLDVGRFAQAFAHDKLMFNKWGQIKIRMELRRHELDEEVIQDALASVDEKEYYLVLREVLIKKWSQFEEEAISPMKRQKLINHALQKGFRADEVMRVMDDWVGG